MGTAVQTPERDTGGWPLLFGLMAVSALAHVVTIVLLPHTRPPVDKKNVVEMAFYQPPPPPPPKVEEPEKPKELEKPKPKPIVKADTPKPPEPLPPPPNDTPPEQPTKPVPIVVGVTLSSTTAAGGFAVQVGNTTMGKASDKVVDAANVKPYSAPKYAPPGSADSDPELIGDVRIVYPPDALKAQVEGNVRLRLTVSAEGNVEKVVILDGPGYGLNEAARDALSRARFKPAMKGGEPVGYTIVWTYTFVID
jgi:protein TonB